MTGQTLWALVGTAHVCEMLDLLRKDGECRQSYIGEKTGENDGRVNAKLAMLEENGLVSHRYGMSGRTKHCAWHWSLTPKGAELAEALERCRCIFEGEADLDDPSGRQ